MNGNGDVIYDDFTDFAAALLNPPACGSIEYYNAKVNSDGKNDDLDIAPFIKLVLANGGIGTPRP